jgi:hypothetical protein
MAVTRRETSTTVEFTHGSTANDLREALAGIPGSARMQVTHYAGDQREPSYTSIKFTWDPSRSDS